MNLAARQVANWYSKDLVTPGIHATWYNDGMIIYVAAPNLTISTLIPLFRQFAHNFSGFAIEQSEDKRVIAVILDNVEFPEVIMSFLSDLARKSALKLTYVDNRGKDHNNVEAFLSLIEGV